MTLPIDKAKPSTAKAPEEITESPEVAENSAGAEANTGETTPPSFEDMVANSMKELGMSREEAFDIIEAIFTHGEYTEVMPVHRKLSVTFRTRTAQEEMRLKSELIRAGDISVWERNHIIQVHNLATSLVALGDRSVNGENSDAAYQDRRKFVLALPNALVDVLVRLLAKFDDKVIVACQDPVLRDF